MNDRSGDSPREGVSAGAVIRKPYESPKLRVYGDVAAITRSAGMTATAQPDGGHGNNKTH
jgi:hypothetical protein